MSLKYLRFVQQGEGNKNSIVSTSVQDVIITPDNILSGALIFYHISIVYNQVCWLKKIITCLLREPPTVSSGGITDETQCSIQYWENQNKQQNTKKRNLFVLFFIITLQRAFKLQTFTNHSRRLVACKSLNVNDKLKGPAPETGKRFSLKR